MAHQKIRKFTSLHRPKGVLLNEDSKLVTRVVRLMKLQLYLLENIHI